MKSGLFRGNVTFSTFPISRLLRSQRLPLRETCHLRSVGRQQDLDCVQGGEGSQRGNRECRGETL